MDPITLVGVDPGSQAFDCCLIRTTSRQTSYRTFSMCTSELAAWIQWLKHEKVNLIALEGSGGMCVPLEKAIQQTDIPLYSVSPYRVGKYRQALSGQHKSNRKDAAAVAEFALQLHEHGRLEEYRRTWFPDPNLRRFTRMYEQKQKEATREINRLWSAIHQACPDLFQALHALGGNGSSALTRIWVLKLIAMYPDSSSWAQLSAQELAKRIGQGRSHVRDHMLALQKAVQGVPPGDSGEIVAIKNLAGTALALKQCADAFHRHITVETTKNPATVALMRYKGIGPIIAAQFVSEIIHIGRFQNNHKLASYAGIGRAEHKTGGNMVERAQRLYNRRLKNACYSMARSVTLHNPDSHLTAYYHALRAKGMRHMAAYKRVARALLRIIFRDLKRVAANQVPVHQVHENKARHEGNPDFSPERAKDPPAPHAPHTLVAHRTTSGSTGEAQAPAHPEVVAVGARSGQAAGEAYRG